MIAVSETFNPYKSIGSFFGQSWAFYSSYSGC
jgi:hypothetical protein